MQRAEQNEQKVQAANSTALQAIGSRKRKLDCETKNSEVLKISKLFSKLYK